MRSTHIHGVSDQRRLVLGGKVKIGERKTITTKGNKEVEIPTKLDYFRFVPDNPQLLEDFQAIYGPEPRQLPIMLPSNDRGQAFPQAFCCWKAKKLWCTGDNQTASRATATGGREEVPCNDQCPFRYMPGLPDGEEKKQRTCKPEGLLRFMLPELPTMHVFTFKAAKMSIESINTSLDLVEGMCGRIGFVPMNMSLVPVQVTINNAAMAVYVVRLDVRISMASLAAAFNPKSMLGQDGMGLKALGPALQVEADSEEDDAEEEAGAFTGSTQQGVADLYGPEEPAKAARTALAQTTAPAPPAPDPARGKASEVADQRAEEFDQLYAQTAETLEFFAQDESLHKQLSMSLKNCRNLGDLKGFNAYLAKKIESTQQERAKEKAAGGSGADESGLI